MPLNKNAAKEEKTREETKTNLNNAEETKFFDNALFKSKRNETTPKGSTNKQRCRKSIFL